MNNVNTRGVTACVFILNVVARTKMDVVGNKFPSCIPVKLLIDS